MPFGGVKISERSLLLKAVLVYHPEINQAKKAFHRNALIIRACVAFKVYIMYKVLQPQQTTSWLHEVDDTVDTF